MTKNAVGWFEIYVQDMDRATKFYSTVLDTALENLETPPMPGPEISMMAFPMQPDQQGAPGALVKMEGVPSGGMGTMVYFNCDDCAVEAGRVNDAGGELKQDKMSIGQYGFIAIATDTEGNTFGLHSQQ